MRESDGLRSEIDQLKEINKETTQINYHEMHENGINCIKDIAIEKFPVDLKKCSSPISDKQKRKVLEGFRTLDMESSRRDKLIGVGSDKSISESEEFKCGNGDLMCSGVLLEQDQVNAMRGNITHSGSVVPFHMGSNKITETETRISLAAAGAIEALSVLTCENSIQTRYETALSDEVRRSLLQYGRGNMDPIQWGKYRVFRGHYYVGREAVSAVIVEVRWNCFHVLMLCTE